MLANLRGQRLGPGTVADLALPDAFLRRVAGRTLQTWFHERFRIVVDDLGEGHSELPPPPEADPADLPPGAVRVDCPDPPVSALAPAAPPAARNFRWPAAGHAQQNPATDASPLHQELSKLIATSLAKDGLLRCAARSLSLITRARPQTQPREALALLGGSGFPTDLLASFSPRPDTADGASVCAWLLQQLGSDSAERLRPAPAGVPFRFRPSAPGFAGIPDSGQVEPDVLRIQLTRAGYYAAPGDGGSFDILRQLLEKTNARLLVHAQTRHAAALRSQAREWPSGFLDRITLLVQASPLSQWAQDSAKSGGLPDGQPATLTPRFASRGEEASQFVVGDSCAATALAAAGQRVVHSPLLFQGGNLLVVQEPSGQRTLLIGEAEVHRNRSLGLSSEHAIAALTSELGAHRAVVLPAASIHLDYEVSVRVHNGRVVALVNDTPAAIAIILAVTVDALGAAGALSASQAADARAHLEDSRFKQLLALLRPALHSPARPPGQFPLSLARHFQRGDPDSGVGNLLRCLAALDAHAALGNEGSEDPYLAAYFRAIQRQEQDRLVLREQIRALGWHVQPVPSFSLGDRSVNALNGIHTPRAFFMPAYGGFFAPLDAAAATSIARAFQSQVQVLPILSGESQRRDGAVHCSVSVLAGR